MKLNEKNEIMWFIVRFQSYECLKLVSFHTAFANEEKKIQSEE